METVKSLRQFDVALFQRKMSRWEIEAEILKTERKFRKADKDGQVSEMFHLQDELGELYRRLMNMQRAINKK